MNSKKVLLHKPKILFSKLSGACQVSGVCFKWPVRGDVTDFEAYKEKCILSLAATHHVPMHARCPITKIE
jgi:hypothetical protein